MKVIGLTGGIASGKSMLANHLRELGIPVLDADQAARVVVEPGSPALRELKDLWGDWVLTEDGQMNRPMVAQKVFSDKTARQELNRILHPQILRYMQELTAEAARGGADLICWDVPLLVDLGWQKYVDAVWVVQADPEQQLQRMCLRDGMSEDEAWQRLAAQITPAEREQAAHELIDNRGTPEAACGQLRDLVMKYRGQV